VIEVPFLLNLEFSSKKILFQFFLNEKYRVKILIKKIQIRGGVRGTLGSLHFFSKSVRVSNEKKIEVRKMKEGESKKVKVKVAVKLRRCRVRVRV
jgi:hypothetical protein